MEANYTNEQMNDLIFNQENDLINDVSTSNVQNNHQTKEKAKKCRGNRKLQRYRRKLRQQGMDSDTITKLINSFVDTTQSKSDKVTQEQNEKTTPTTINDETTMFHVVKANEKKKNQKQNKNIKKKPIIVKKKNNNSSTSVSNRKVKTAPLIKDSFDYGSIPDEVFFQMSSTVFDRTQNIVCPLNEDEKIKFIRHYTSLIDRLCYVKLQEFQWKYYYQIGMTENIWKGYIVKQRADKYSICSTYGRSKVLIEQRLKQIEQHLEKAQNAIQQFEEEFSSKFGQNIDYSFIMKQWYSVLYQFVQEKQRSLQHDYEYKREILVLDAVDHQLLQKFFDAEPNKSQVTEYILSNIRQYCISILILINFRSSQQDVYG